VLGGRGAWGKVRWEGPATPGGETGGAWREGSKTLATGRPVTGISNTTNISMIKKIICTKP